jgi:hypothetical protein
MADAHNGWSARVHDLPTVIAAWTVKCHPLGAFAASEVDWTVLAHLGDPGLRLLDCMVFLIPDPKITYQVVPGGSSSKRRTSQEHNSPICTMIFPTGRNHIASCCRQRFSLLQRWEC